jgi:hypothetical protein
MWPTPQVLCLERRRSPISTGGATGGEIGRRTGNSDVDKVLDELQRNNGRCRVARALVVAYQFCGPLDGQLLRDDAPLS